MGKDCSRFASFCKDYTKYLDMDILNGYSFFIKFYDETV